MERDWTRVTLGCAVKQRSHLHLFDMEAFIQSTLHYDKGTQSYSEAQILVVSALLYPFTE